MWSSMKALEPVFGRLEFDLSPVLKTKGGSVILDLTPGAHWERVSADRVWPEKSASWRFCFHFPDTIQQNKNRKTPNGNLIKWGKENVITSPSRHTGLDVLPLFCPICLSWFKPHLHLIPEKTNSGTIKECLLGNGSCVLHRTLTSPGLLWKHAMRGGAYASLSGSSQQANQTLPKGLKAKSESQWGNKITKAFTWCNLSLPSGEQLWGLSRQAALSVFTSVSFNMLFLHFESSLSTSTSLWLRLKHPGSPWFQLTGHHSLRKQEVIREEQLSIMFPRIRQTSDKIWFLFLWLHWNIWVSNIRTPLDWYYFWNINSLIPHSNTSIYYHLDATRRGGLSLRVIMGFRKNETVTFA